MGEHDELDSIIYYFKRWGTEWRLKRRSTAHHSHALLTPIPVYTALKKTPMVDCQELWGSKT